MLGPSLLADIAVFASGRGSNFIALHRELEKTGTHRVAVLICDRKAAAALEYARSNGIDAVYCPYKDRSPDEVERQIIERLRPYRPELLVLAGYMRLLTPRLINEFPDRIINIHPSLLPRHPGVDSIRRSWESGDEYLGITIHFVDEGMDTGKIIVQQAFHRSEAQNLEAAQARIHELEHFWYHRTVAAILDGETPAKRT
jgi:phosphoribosylglycinamide formyltransferase-1